MLSLLTSVVSITKLALITLLVIIANLPEFYFYHFPLLICTSDPTANIKGSVPFINTITEHRLPPAVFTEVSTRRSQAASFPARSRSFPAAVHLSLYNLFTLSHGEPLTQKIRPFRADLSFIQQVLPKPFGIINFRYVPWVLTNCLEIAFSQNELLPCLCAFSKMVIYLPISPVVPMIYKSTKVFFKGNQRSTC